MNSLVKSFKVGKLNVNIYKNRESMGEAAAEKAEEYLVNLLNQKEEIRIIFAAASSQNETLKHLIPKKSIDWKRVVAFHMDKYIGVSPDSPQNLGSFLKKAIFELLPFKNVRYLNPLAQDTEEECKRYAKLINEKPIDIVFMGIGENGHIAFNDPHVANFNDPFTVKTVAIDNISKQQQVNEGNFRDVEKVPDIAYTLTVPTLFKGKKLFCMVPGPTKSKAVKQTLTAPINEKCPATILRKHENAELFLDTNSASGLSDKIVNHIDHNYRS